MQCSSSITFDHGFIHELVSGLNPGLNCTSLHTGRVLINTLKPGCVFKYFCSRMN